MTTQRETHLTMAHDADDGAPAGVITVALGIDEAYAPHAAATISSIRQQSPGAAFQFLILHDGVPQHARMRVEASAPDATFIWTEITDSNVLALSGRDHISRATFYRLVLPHLAPAGVRRIVYLDSDLIVTRDLRALWSVDLQGAPLGAVCDSGMAWRSFAEAYGLDPGAGPYFNAGVLLIDLEHVRRERLFDQALERLQAHDLHYMDQDALNLALWGRWRPLDPIWNVQHTMLLGDAAQGVPDDMLAHGRKPAIIHYTGHHKPWLKDSYHPFAWRYWRALRRTTYFHDVARRQGVTLVHRMRLMMRDAAHSALLRG